jgi:hypothetical protein
LMRWHRRPRIGEGAVQARPTRLAVILQRRASKLPLDDAVSECLECEDEHVPWSWCFVLLSRIRRVSLPTTRPAYVELRKVTQYQQNLKCCTNALYTRDAQVWIRSPFQRCAHVHMDATYACQTWTAGHTIETHETSLP